MTEEQKTFVRKAGTAWPKALAAAALHIRSNGTKLIAADKIREEAIQEAALRALDHPKPGSRSLANLLLDADPEFVRMVDRLIVEAAGAARGAVKG